MPTVAVEVADGDKRMVYSSDTGPGWLPSAFGSRPDMVLSEASYQEAAKGPPIHLTPAEAGRAAKEAGARRLVITHVWPSSDPVVSVAEAEEAFGAPVTLAATHLTTRI